MPTAGVYGIQNGITGDAYIGSSAHIEKRWRSHLRTLNAGTHHSAYLQRAWNKYGADTFTWHFLEATDPTREFLLGAEQRYLEWVRPTYNMNPLATSQLGARRSDETKAKMRAPHPERSAKISAAGKGRVTGEETKVKLSARLKGIPKSAETKAKISAAKMGHPVSQETKERLSAAQTHEPLSEEIKVKIMAGQQRALDDGRWHSGHPQSPETRAKIGAASRGRIASEETRLRMSAAQKRAKALYWAAKGF